MTTKAQTRKRITASHGPIANGLDERAMLVKLKINRWGAKRNDDSTANEIAAMKNSDATLGKFTKQLLKSDALSNYRKKVRECRKFHKMLTLPWDEGVGLLPGELYFKYTEGIGERRAEGEQYVEDFVGEYTEQWNNGLSVYKKALGDLFDEGDYPDPAKVRSKFGIHVRCYPIQNPDDFRVKMSGDVASDLKKQMHLDLVESLSEASRAPIIRLHEAITKVHEKLSDGDSIFRDSLIGNVQELVELLPALNVLNDPEITELIGKAKKEICSITDMKGLRQDQQYRKQVAKSAESILKSMRGYGS